MTASKSELFYIECKDILKGGNHEIQINYEAKFIYLQNGRDFKITELSDRFIQGISPDHSFYERSEIIIDRLNGSGNVRKADIISDQLFHDFEDCKKIDYRF